MVTTTMTTQEAYETARAWFLKDRRYGWDPQSKSCVYLGPQGQRCIVGSLIPKRLYDSSFEDNPVDNIIDWNAELHDLLNGYDEEGQRKLRFLVAAQKLHDECASRVKRDALGRVVYEDESQTVAVRESVPIEEFISRLDDLARRYDLTVPA